MFDCPLILVTDIRVPSVRENLSNRHTSFMIPVTARPSVVFIKLTAVIIEDEL